MFTFISVETKIFMRSYIWDQDKECFSRNAKLRNEKIIVKEIKTRITSESFSNVLVSFITFTKIWDPI